MGLKMHSKGLQDGDPVSLQSAAFGSMPALTEPIAQIMQ
jgi:hypothetical protein